jgi:hypothetical protein
MKLFAENHARTAAEMRFRESKNGRRSAYTWGAHQGDEVINPAS